MIYSILALIFGISVTSTTINIDDISGAQSSVYEIQEVNSEIDILANVVYAEAGNQGYEGQRLVCSVILNRVESEKFPNTITEVVMQPGQFSCVWDGGIQRHKPTEETYQVCRDELRNRSNNGFLFFRTTTYNSSREYKYKDHYFL